MTSSSSILRSTGPRHPTPPPHSTGTAPLLRRASSPHAPPGVSAVSWAAMLATFRGSQCALVRIRGRDDATNSFLAGAFPPPSPPPLHTRRPHPPSSPPLTPLLQELSPVSSQRSPPATPVTWPCPQQSQASSPAQCADPYRLAPRPLPIAFTTLGLLCFALALPSRSPLAQAHRQRQIFLSIAPLPVASLMQQRTSLPPPLLPLMLTPLA
jgi:hypothetical protein